MRRQAYIPFIVVIGLLVAGIIAYNRSHKPVLGESSEANQNVTLDGDAGLSQATSEQHPQTAQSNKVYRVRVDQSLATVNGVAITLGDLFPVRTVTPDVTQEIEADTYDYFLKRAIDRELTIQTAKAQGIDINESQNQQLIKMQGLRVQPEPGLLHKFTVDAAQIQFELRDARTFMLQNNLLAQQGSSPNVTSDQVQAYYQAHVAELGELPSDPEIRKETWQKIDINIRGQLAADMRTKYQKELASYLDRLRAAANISTATLIPVEAAPPPLSSASNR